MASRTPRKILLLNSDSPNNKGDRAILEGNLKLLRSKWPGAEIWIVSEYPQRDASWHQVHCLPFPVYTTNPLSVLRILLFAASCDLIFWGGGELLKDYTNKIGVVYWALRVLPLRLVNRNLVGLFQGIGPTHSRTGQRLIVRMVNACRCFIVRDAVSKDKLLAWGVSKPVIASFDPAILNLPQGHSAEFPAMLEKNFNISDTFMANAIGVGIRRWFHYTKGGLLPHRYHRQSDVARQAVATYRQNLADFLDAVVERHRVNIVFFPMFNTASEGDDVFSEEVRQRMRNADRVRILAGDIVSPRDYLSLIARCRIFIASRLHSSILATSALVPALVFYYSDKGKLFFEQIGMQQFSQPIEELQGVPALDKHLQQVDALLHEREVYQEHLAAVMQKLRNRIEEDFDNAIKKLDSHD